MKKHLLLLSFILSFFLLFLFDAFSKPNTLLKIDQSNNKNIAYTIFIKGEDRGNGFVSPGKLVEVPYLPQSEYASNRIILKTKNYYGGKKDEILENSYYLKSVFNSLGVEDIRIPFNNKLNHGYLTNDHFGINRILEITYNAPIDVYNACIELLKSPEIEYATPIFHRYTYLVPNDPQQSNQWAINKMNMPKAWDISTGSKEVIIGIVDSGVDWKHEDLSSNIWLNPKEVLNGIDDDGNGKIDDIRGWDIVGNVSPADADAGRFKPDNDPINNSAPHGTHVAGCASAVTNNGKGIAGMGYNCSILPVKCGTEQSSMYIFGGYEGIVYAADMGCKVINCSWGGAGYSPAEQDVINYAVSKGAVVVVAAGNSRANVDDGGQYPAGYDNVLCVGATSSNDRSASFSNYGYAVTVYTPGQTIYSTYPNNQYRNMDGTSMASPVTAGVAGLLISYNSALTPLQVIHQIRSTSDNVVTTNQNNRPLYYGRINAEKALTYNTGDPNKAIPGVGISDYSLEGTDALTDYTTKNLRLVITNFIGYARNLKVTFSPMYDYITISTKEVSLGDLSVLNSKNISLQVSLKNTNPWFKGTANIIVTFEAENYIDYYLLKIPVNIPSQNSFYPVYSFPEYYNPYWHSIHSPSENSVWAVGQSGIFGNYSGFLLRTQNGIRTNTISTNIIYCIHSFDDYRAIAGSGSQDNSTALIFQTGDAGTTWTQVNVSSITGFINDIYFFNSTRGIFLGDTKNNKWGVATTSDGGVNWSQISNIPDPLANESGYVGCSYVLNENVWFGTNKGRIFKSTNGGNLWKVGTIQNAVRILRIGFSDSLNGVATYTEADADDATIYLARTYNGGTNWFPRVYNFTANKLTPIRFFTGKGSGKIYTLCTGGQVFETSDLGTTWVPILSQRSGTIQNCASYNYKGNRIRLWHFSKRIDYLDFSFIPKDAIKELTLLPNDELTYDTVELTKERTRSINISNTGNMDIQIKSIEIKYYPGIDSSEFRIISGIPQVIYPGETKKVLILFKPKDIGERVSDLLINSDAQNDNIIVRLRGYCSPQTSVNNINQNNSLIVSDYLNFINKELILEIYSNYEQYIEIEVYNFLGKKLLNIDNKHILNGRNEFIIDLNHFSDGVYFYTIKTNNHCYSKKFLIMKK